MSRISTGLNDPGRPSAGVLLVATPEIPEGEFWRSVILLLDHDDTGSLGVILNQLTDVPVADLVPGWAHVLFPTVARGGPVSANGAVAVGRLVSPLAPDAVASEVLAGPRRRLQVVAGAWALIDLEADPADTPPLRDAQLFAGYAGWGPGQLQAELRSGSWWVVASHAGDLRLVRELDQVSAWRAVLGRQNSDLKFAATFPADPAHN